MPNSFPSSALSSVSDQIMLRLDRMAIRTQCLQVLSAVQIVRLCSIHVCVERHNVIHLVRWWQHPSAHSASVSLIVSNNLLQRLRHSSRAFGARPNRVLLSIVPLNQVLPLEPLLVLLTLDLVEPPRLMFHRLLIMVTVSVILVRVAVAEVQTIIVHAVIQTAEILVKRFQ